VGRKRKNAITFGKPSSEDGIDNSVSENSAPSPRRISIPLNDDGSVAIGSMRDDQISDWKKLIRRPEIVEEITPKVVEVISKETCDGIYDVAGKGLSLLAVQFKNVPSEIADKAFPFNEMEKEMLSKPTARILNKYAPGWLTKYQDEISLCFLLVTIINAKIQLCTALMNVSANSPKTEPIPINSNSVNGETKAVSLQ
jgi:hypothetical protein